MIAVGLGADIESEVKKRVPFFLPFFRSRSTMDIDGLPRQARDRRTVVCQDRLGTDVRKAPLKQSSFLLTANRGGTASRTAW